MPPGLVYFDAVPLLLIAILLALAGCGGSYPQSTLAPKSDFSAAVDVLFTDIFWWAVVVFVIVEGLLLFAIVRYRARAPALPSPGRCTDIPRSRSGGRSRRR